MFSTKNEKVAKSGQKIPKTDMGGCHGLVFGHFGPLLTIFGLCAIKIKFKSCNCGPNLRPIALKITELSRNVYFVGGVFFQGGST